MAFSFLTNPWAKPEKKPKGPPVKEARPIPVITPSKIKSSGMSAPVVTPPALPKPKVNDFGLSKGGFRSFTPAEKVQEKKFQKGAGESVNTGLQAFIGDPLRAAFKAFSRPKTLFSAATANIPGLLYNAATEKPVDFNFTPTNPVAKAVLGEEPVTGLGGGLTGRVSELAGKFAKKSGLPKGPAENITQTAMLPFMLLAADPRLGPGEAAAREAAEKFVKEATEKFGKEVVEKVLKEGGAEAVAKLAQKEAKGLKSLYHGTTVEFEGAMRPGEDGMVWFGKDKNAALQYTSPEGFGSSQLRNRTSLEEPKIGKPRVIEVDPTGLKFKDLGDSIFKDPMFIDEPEVVYEEAIKLAKKEGYDGIKTLHPSADFMGADESYGVFNVDKIKLKDTKEAIPVVSRVASDVVDATKVAPPALPTVPEATGLAKKEADKWAGSINLDKLNTPDDVKAMIKTVAEATKAEHAAAGRGVQKIETTRKLAEQLGLQPTDVTNRRIGQALNAEEQEAYSQLMIKQAERLKATEDIIMNGGTDADLANYAVELNRYAMLQASASGARAEAGRALNILKYAKDAAKDTPERLQEEVIKAYGGKRMTKEIAAHLISARKLAEETGDFTGYFDLIRKANKPSFFDHAYEWWINSILSNPKTHIVNTLSNTAQALKQVAERGAQATIELARGGKREVTFGEVGHMVSGMVNGFNDGVSRFLHVWKNGVSPEELLKLDTSRLPVISGKVGQAVRAPTTMLAAEDEFFKAIASRGEVYAQAYRAARKEGWTGKKLTERAAELISNPTDDMMKAAKEHAQGSTFQSELGDFAKIVVKYRNKVPGLRYLIPFVRTPLNIFKEAVRSTPLGFLETGAKALRGEAATDVTKSAAKAAIGTAMSVPIVMGFLNNKMTGSVPNDPAERDKFYREGKKPMSVKIGKTWYSLARLEPLATVIGMIGNVVDNVKKGEDVTTQAFDIVNALSSQIEDKTFLQGLSDIIDLATGRADEKSYVLKKLVLGTITGFEPQFVSQVAKSIDPTYRDVKDDDWMQQLIKTIKSRTPWLSQSVPATLDAFGKPAQRTGGFMERFLSPVERGIETTDPVEAELTRLGVNVGKPARSKQVGGVKGKLDVDTYRQYLKDTGEIGHARLVQLMALPEYKTLSANDQEDIINETITKTRKQVSELKTGELLLSLAGVRDAGNKKVMGAMNDLYSAIIKTSEWKDMDDEEKLKMLLDDFATLTLRFAND